MAESQLSQPARLAGRVDPTVTSGARMQQSLLNPELRGHVLGWNVQPPAPVKVLVGCLDEVDPDSLPVGNLEEQMAYLDEDNEILFPEVLPGKLYVIVTPRDVIVTTATREGEDWTASVDGEGPAEGQPEDVGTSRAVATADGRRNVFYVEALGRLSAGPRLVVRFEAVPVAVASLAEQRPPAPETGTL